MPTFKYSYDRFDPLTHVRASGREVNVSPKATREVCRAIKGWSLPRAKIYLQDVMVLKAVVHFRRYNKEVGHARSSEKFHAGRYPVKAAKEVLTVLEAVESNAEFKGLDAERMRIIHAASHRGRKVQGFTPRAFGRASPSNNTLTHIELVAGEV